MGAPLLAGFAEKACPEQAQRVERVGISFDQQMKVSRL